MPNMRRIVPVRAKPLNGNLFCTSGRAGAKYHVSFYLQGLPFGPRCHKNNAENMSAYPDNTEIEITDICKRCLKYTEEVK